MLLLILLCVAANAIIVIDTRGREANTLIAVQAAAGLENREKASVYVVNDDRDVFWLNTLLNNDTVVKPNNDTVVKPNNDTVVKPEVFLNTSYKKWGGILYNNKTANLQSIVTLSGILSAIPIDFELLNQFPYTKIVYNANASNFNVIMKYLNETTSLAIQNTENIEKGHLVDWIVNQKLLTLYLPNMCLPWSQDHKLLKRITDESNWPRPIRVYGYNFQNPILGAFPWEAETTCIRTMGQIASSSSTNLAFWSKWKNRENKENRENRENKENRENRENEQLKQPRENYIEYAPNKTYIALVYGDLDNIDFVQTIGQEHMRKRVERCLMKPSECFPLTWTLSPNLLRIAPDIMRWYYNQASKTGRDWFIMPPSGTLYSYPGLMDESTQLQYVMDQTRQAIAMDTHGTIHWEIMLTWRAFAFKNYFPRYIGTNGTTSFFLNNVPWMIPILELEGDTYKWFFSESRSGGEVVVFKPAYNWCPGMKMSGYSGTPKEMANKINRLKIGSIQYIYIIQNTDPNDIFDMVNELESHVELVGYQNLVSVAAIAEKKK